MALCWFPTKPPCSQEAGPDGRCFYHSKIAAGLLGFGIVGTGPSTTEGNPPPAGLIFGRHMPSRGDQEAIAVFPGSMLIGEAVDQTIAVLLEQDIRRVGPIEVSAHRLDSGIEIILAGCRIAQAQGIDPLAPVPIGRGRP